MLFVLSFFRIERQKNDNKPGFDKVLSAEAHFFLRLPIIASGRMLNFTIFSRSKVSLAAMSGIEQGSFRQTYLGELSPIFSLDFRKRIWPLNFHEFSRIESTLDSN